MMKMRMIGYRKITRSYESASCNTIVI